MHLMDKIFATKAFKISTTSKKGQKIIKQICSRNHGNTTADLREHDYPPMAAPSLSTGRTAVHGWQHHGTLLVTAPAAARSTATCTPRSKTLGSQRRPPTTVPLMPSTWELSPLELDAPISLASMSVAS